jgi:hypothetical protein
MAACITCSFKWPELDGIATHALAVPSARIAHRIAIIGSSGAVALITKPRKWENGGTLN